MKLIYWKFSDMRSTELALGDHVFLSKGQWEGLLFDVSGLGLTKLEREFFGTRFLEARNIVNIYLGRFIISFDKQGTDVHFRSVQVVKTETVGSALERKITGLLKKLNDGYHDFLNKRQFKEVYEFQIDKYGEGSYTFKTDLLSAFQLANNYGADLMWGGRYVLSPLAFSYKENRDLVRKYLGKRFITKNGAFNLRAYKRYYAPEIRDYKRIA